MPPSQLTEDLGNQDLNKTTAKNMSLFLHIPLINAYTVNVDFVRFEYVVLAKY
jgi:hypothetical protein